MGLLDFLKMPRSDHPDRKAALQGRSQIYNLLDNIIGFDDDRVTPGEAFGAGLREDPVGLLSSGLQGATDDMRGLMFEGEAVQRPEDVLGYAAGVGGGSIAKAGRSAFQYDPSTARMFLGKSASNANIDALNEARELSARRRSPEEIWDKTGWFKGADDEWRFEVSDDMAVLRQPASDALNYGGPGYQTNYQGGLLHQPLLGGSFRGEIFDPAYPSMFGDMNFAREKSPRGSYDLDTGQINVSAPESSEGLPVALHEVQHAIQAQEGFARGSNPGFEISELLAARNNRLKEISKEIEAKQSELGLYGYMPKHPEMDDLYNQYNSLVGRAVSEDQAYQNYIRAAGEVEANNVMNRRRMTAEERAETPPWMTQDFPYEEQIIRKRKGLLQ